MQLHPGPTGDG